MTNKITQFQGEHRWLSNFWPCQIKIWEMTFPSVEHAYQASKAVTTADRHLILNATYPGEAKRAGRQITIRKDWDEVKLSVMEGLVRQKFTQEPFRSKLLATGEAYLIEGNSWGDRYWGICRGEGLNHLGKLIMKIRQELVDVDKRWGAGVKLLKCRACGTNGDHYCPADVARD